MARLNPIRRRRFDSLPPEHPNHKLDDDPQALTAVQRLGIEAELARQPDYGGAFLSDASSGPPKNLGDVASGGLGDVVWWNGAYWGLWRLHKDTGDLWLLPLAGVRKRPILVEPDQNPNAATMVIPGE